jgi:CheY-like chemotaxis protein
MEQVLVNLCVNARDAMPRGGRVAINTVLVNLEALSPVGNPDRRPGRFVCLTVSDTGVGMNAETLGRIFEPFFTTKEVGKGSGLGLSVVYGIVQQHHGWIEAESAPGQGTTFRIYLPHQSGKPEPLTPAPTSQAEIVPGSETILVVEDEAPVRELVCSILQDCGYQVLEAPNGRAALEVWKQHRDRVDLLLTDMVMPEGISGGELADRLVAEKPDLKVLCCSGYSVEFISRHFQASGTASFLPKPYTPAVLTRKVREVLDA